MKDAQFVLKKGINFSLIIFLDSIMERRKEIRRVTSARWWTKYFQGSCPTETLILTTTHGWEYHFGNQGLWQRGHSTLLEQKNLIIDAFNKVKRTISLYPHYSSSIGWHSSVWRDTPTNLSSREISPTGKSEGSEHWLPQLCRTLPQRPTSFLPHPEHWDQHGWIVQE